MPRPLDPGTLNTGPGFDSAEKESTDIGGTSPGLSNHVGSTQGAHTAASISVDLTPDVIGATNVEGALDALSALVPPKPPAMGTFSTVVSQVSGITDWGVLKLNDSQIDLRPGATAEAIDMTEAFGYYYRAPDPADDNPPFSPVGADPSTDLTFNIADGTYTGGGEGSAYAGAFTRDVGGPNPITQSHRIIPDSGGGQGVVASGVVYPADRGVLALIRWPAGGDNAAFLAQALTTRCPAALLLGGGVGSVCDGLISGGIFEPGVDGTDFDPFAFPGQATGQYDLRELHTALSTIDGSALPIVADTTAGQVRLGTDPNAGETPVVGGIPILGAGSVATGGGNDNNFFRYRLPYLSSYTSLQFTPTAQAPRYFLKPTLALNAGTDLTEAGDYGTGFTKDYWTYQLARYRHRFTMDATGLPPGTPREDGAYMLLHFRTEAAFEALVRDGTVPTDDDLYSANLVDWTNPEALENLAADDSANDFPIASGYHVLRAAIFEDPDGTTAPVPTTADFTFSSAIDRIMQISGVQYFLPVHPVTGQVATLDNIRFGATGYFDNTYRTAEPGIPGDAYVGNMNPAVLNLAAFTYDLDGGSPTMTVPPAFVQDSAKVRRQRIEFTYQEFGGTYTAADGPLPADSITIALAPDTISLEGDINNPSFSTDARMRMFLRRPLGHDAVGTTFLPFPSTVLVEASGDRIMYHSTRGSTAAAVYGNIEDPAASGTPAAGVNTATKDYEERFLDEVYRYRGNWNGTLPAADEAVLLGPGFQGNPVAAIEVPVRPSLAAAPYDSVSWFQQRDFTTDLTVTGTIGFNSQVSGLPERAPDFNFPATSPFPSRGICVYPQTDFSTGFRPSTGAGDISVAQFDYSSFTGECDYVRAFDAAFSRSGTVVVAEGQPFLTLRVYGLQLADFAYSAPGPGTADIAIMVKVPGLTTWMDAGRPDGDGPSKQDAFLDGAGCKLVGDPLTLDGTVTDGGFVYSQVRINVGPAVTLFKSANNEVPVLVKVIWKDTAGARALDFTQVSATGDPASLRGLVGLEIIRP